MKIRWFRNLALAAAVAGTVSLSSSALAAGATRSFPDVTQETPAYESIMALAQRSIVIGFEDGLFHPANTISRAEFAIMINRAFGTNGLNTQVMFPDVPRDAWYAQAIRAATYNGTILATDYRTGSGMFLHPEEPITRAEIAAWVARALEARGIEMNGMKPCGFTDLKKGGRFNYQIRQAASIGIVHGTESGLFEPDAVATRSTAALVVYRALNKLNR